jgi:alkaline phosphatase D
MKKTLCTMTAIGVLLAIGLAFCTPLHAENEKSGEESIVRVMTYNACRGGTYQGQPLSQSAKMIQEAQADIVGLQEIGENVPKLAKLLGWNHSGPFLTRYEIVEELKGISRRPSDGMKVKLPSGQEAYVFNNHLPSGPNQAYQLLGLTGGYRSYPKIHTEAEAIAGAKKTRARFITRLFNQIRALPDQEAPVFVVGDFNEPSHLDWTEAAAKSGRHPIKVEFPTSLMMTEAGFTDAYRTVYPDEMAKPGFTWSPVIEPDDPNHHYNRIDFVYFKGKGIEVTDAKVIGENKENADIVVAPYPSDHRAVVATFSLANQAESKTAQEIAGPLVGDIKPDGVTLWMYAPDKSRCTFNYHAGESSLVDKKAGTFTAVQNPAAKGPGRVFKSPLAGLLPDTHYRYQVSIDGKSNPAWEGSFKTAPVEGKPAAFRLAITSCMRIGKPQESWNLLLTEKPDLHITVGDTHYADTTDPTMQLKHHVTYRREKEFAKVLRHIPIYAIWDDHDYGPNNSDGTAKGKEFSLAGWEQAWANPELGTAETPGAFFKFSHGDVEFFVVDGRYHRSPNEVPDDEKKRMLGDAQFEWLLEGLKNSNARFKVIASGSTLHHSEVDGWRIYTFSRHRLFDAIKENEISGVMYLSGDMHRSLVWEHHESDRVGYPMIEVMSSGITNGRDLSFATIDFDTTRDDPTARVRIILGDGKVRTDKTWKLSQLGHTRKL